MNTLSASYRVLYGDTDAAGVVYNANYLRFFELSRNEFMRNLVCPYKAIEDMGIVLPVTESWVRYKAPAHYDDLITIEGTLAELSSFKSKFTYRVLRDEEGKQKLLAKGYTIHAPITRDGKLTRLPKELFELMKPHAAKIISKS